MNATGKKWLDKHDACADARAWLDTQPSMHAAWQSCTRFDWMLWALDKHGGASDRDLRLFAAWCARQVAHLNPDPRVMAAIVAAEAFARLREGQGVPTKECEPTGRERLIPIVHCRFKRQFITHLLAAFLSH
jgi:hypothetical protein